MKSKPIVLWCKVLYVYNKGEAPLHSGWKRLKQKRQLLGGTLCAQHANLLGSGVTNPN